MVTNGDMELATYWLGVGASNQKQNNLDKHTGSYSWHNTGNATDNGFWSSTIIPFQTGKKYRISFWYRVVSGNLLYIGPGYEGALQNDTSAQQIADGGFNLAWCTEQELDTASTHDLRARLYAPELKNQPTLMSDPTHLAYINLFPVGCDNNQLGIEYIEDYTNTDYYREYLRQYIKYVNPDILIYDH